MDLLDFLSNGSGGGLLDFLRNNAPNNRQFPGLMPSDTAQYGQPTGAMAQAPIMPQQNAQQAPPSGYMPSPAPQQPAPQMPPQQASQAMQPQAPAMPQQSSPGGLGAGLSGFINNLHAGPIGALIGGVGSAMGMQDPATQAAVRQANVTAQALHARGVPADVIAAAVGNGTTPGNSELLKTIVTQTFGDKNIDNLGNGYIRDRRTGQITRGYEPEDKTPTSVLEYKYYRDNLPAGEKAIPYDVWSTAKARAAAATNTNVNNVDMNSGQTYDKQLAEGLGKSHAALANGVEDAQTRARDIAAMQGAVDSIQKSGNKTGGLGQTQMLDLKKTINAGASALGMEPFSEADIADKEFLTKFNRSMAGAQAKNAVGNRVTNFEMGNFLKANPGLDMSVTGNQRLLGINAQIEQRNIAVGNAIRDATAEAISQGRKIDPVTVQKIISSYDQDHHIKDVVTGQDLTQSVALPEFQGGANTPAAATHGSNITNLKSKYGLK